MNTVRQEHIDGIGDIRVQKKRGVRRISLRLHASGEVRVSQPMYVPFSAGIVFAKSHREWIAKQKRTLQPLQLYDGMQIGKTYIVRTQVSKTVRTRLGGHELTVYTPDTSLLNLTVKEVALIKKAIKRAVNIDAKQLLPLRVLTIAERTGLSYKNITIKPLKSRWGSCSNNQELTFNCYLMMLPDECIDYVIVHELAHTRHMNHGKAFWAEVERIAPTYQTTRRKLKQLQPSVHAFYV